MHSLISRAIVISQDPDNYGVNVALVGAYGGSGPTVAVQVMTHGPRDAVRGSFPELPTPGTPGIVLFPSGDQRNGAWVGAISTNLVDASPHGPGKGNVSHTAHYGGGYSDRAQDGSYSEVFPDGSSLRVGPTVAAPTRHTLAGQDKARTAWPVSQRVVGAPSPFTAVLTQPTGATAVLSPAGAWTLHAASGQALTLTANGASVVLDASGQVIITGTDIQFNNGGATGVLSSTGGWTFTAAAGQGIGMIANGGTIALDASGVATLTASTVNVTNGSGALQAVKLANNANSVVLKSV